MWECAGWVGVVHLALALPSLIGVVTWVWFQGWERLLV